MSNDMRVWVGCLGCYNGGNLAGQWFDADDAPEDMTGEDGFNAVVDEREVKLSADHYAEGHEELWVFDHEGFGDLLSGECSPMDAKRIAEVVADLDDDAREAYGFWRANTGEAVDADTLEQFRESYMGLHDSERAYAEHLYEDVEIPDELPFRCIDWDHVARELFMGEYWSADASNYRGAHVFRSY